MYQLLFFLKKKPIHQRQPPRGFSKKIYNLGISRITVVPVKYPSQQIDGHRKLGKALEKQNGIPMSYAKT